MVFEPMKEGERPPAHETKEQSARRQVAEASDAAPRIGARSDVDLGIPDGTGGWKTLYQMKYIEANPRSASPGQTVLSVAERVEKAATKYAAPQIKYADKAQTDRGEAPAVKIIEIRAEAPHADLDPSSWAPEFMKSNPGITVFIYSTDGGPPWKIPP